MKLSNTHYAMINRNGLFTNAFGYWQTNPMTQKKVLDSKVHPRAVRMTDGNTLVILFRPDRQECIAYKNYGGKASLLTLQESHKLQLWLDERAATLIPSQRPLEQPRVQAS
jgi:hypothetical protein